MSRSCPNYSYQTPPDWKDRGIETVQCSRVQKGPWKRAAGICLFSYLRNTEIDFNTREALARRAWTRWLHQISGRVDGSYVSVGCTLPPHVPSPRAGSPVEPALGTLPPRDFQVSDQVACTEEKGSTLGFLFSIFTTVLRH